MEILNLHRLRHLIVYRCKYDYGYSLHSIQSFKAPCDIGRSFPDLVKLFCVDANESNGMKMVRERGKLTQLRKLGITNLRSEDGKELCSSIAKLTNLRSLIIRSVDEGENLDLDYPVSFPLLRQLGLVPEWTRSLNGLTRLVLNLSGLREDPLNSIQDLPNLSLLRIYGAYIDGLRFKAQGFQKLKRLISQKLECLKSVIVEKAVLKLQIADGAASWNGAFGSSSITSIDEYGGWIVEERQNQGDNWRLSHVPEISFWRKMDDGTLVPREV